MAKFEVLQERDSLSHTDVTIDFEAHVSHRVSRINVPDDVFCDDVQA